MKWDNPSLAVVIDGFYVNRVDRTHYAVFLCGDVSCLIGAMMVMPFAIYLI